MVRQATRRIWAPGRQWQQPREVLIQPALKTAIRGLGDRQLREQKRDLIGDRSLRLHGFVRSRQPGNLR